MSPCFWSVLLVATTTATAEVSSLTDMYGSVRSPCFPEPYPRESTLRWNISVAEGYRIQLYFTHFDLEPSYLCEYDYVKVESEGEVLALFCGQEGTDTEQVPGEQVVSSARNRLDLLFHSDFSNEERFTGFQAHYSAVDVDECVDRSDEDLVCDHYCHNYIGGYYCSCRYGYLLHADNHTCRVECSGVVFREPRGAFGSVDYPQPYPKSSDCTFLIQLEEGMEVTLLFHDRFDVEDHPEMRCPYDHVKVTAGDHEYGPFCGERSPGRIETHNHVVQVVFHTDNSGEHLGWRLTYTSTGSQCPIPVSPANGLLNPVQSEYSFRDHVLVTCLAGYKLLKDEEYLDHYQMDCQRDGSWSSDVPQCQMLDCGSPKMVALADVVFGSHDNSTLLGSTIHYSCKGDTLHLYPRINSSYSCSDEGIWTNSEVGTKLPSCLTACGQPSRRHPRQQKRIVGGRSAAPGLFPWQVLLSVEDRSRVPVDRWFSSGALLSDTWVLTAAHVLRSQRRDASVVPVERDHITVYLGLHDARDKHLATRRDVERLLLHPDFQPQNYDNDIALVKLSEVVRFTELVRPVCLPTPQNQEGPPPNTLGLVAGWGVSSPSPSDDSANATAGANATHEPSGAPSDLLRYVALPVVPQGECVASYASRSANYSVTGNMFCAGFYRGGGDTCLGDSGGAFVTRDQGLRGWAVLGLVSWGGPEDCGSQRVYGVYTRVTNYVGWIQKHVDTAPWW